MNLDIYTTACTNPVRAFKTNSYIHTYSRLNILPNGEINNCNGQFGLGIVSWCRPVAYGTRSIILEEHHRLLFTRSSNKRRAMESDIQNQGSKLSSVPSVSSNTIKVKLLRLTVERPSERICFLAIPSLSGS